MGSIVELLGRTAPFAGLSAEGLSELAATVRERRLVPGEVLYCQGERAHGLYVVRAGVLKLVVSARDGREAIMGLVAAGEPLGEAAVVDGLGHADTAVALTSAEALLVPAAAFWRTMEREPAALRALAALLCGRVRRACEEVADRAWLDARARVAKRLLELAESYGRPSPHGATEIALPLTQSDLAQLVGAGRESVNRAMRQFREDGAVAIWSGRLVVLDATRLARYAELDSGDEAAGKAA